MKGSVKQLERGIKEQLRERVKGVRGKRGWAQEDLARAIDVSLFTVQHWQRKGSKTNYLAHREIARLFKKARINDEEEEQRFTALVE